MLNDHDSVPAERMLAPLIGSSNEHTLLPRSGHWPRAISELSDMQQ
jgi:hypothetical protein